MSPSRSFTHGRAKDRGVQQQIGEFLLQHGLSRDRDMPFELRFGDQSPEAFFFRTGTCDDAFERNPTIPKDRTGRDEVVEPLLFHQPADACDATPRRAFRLSLYLGHSAEVDSAVNDRQPLSVAAQLLVKTSVEF